ncbi:Putative F0F1-ATPase subunit Ca2+/Mg2+ transporter [Flavobacterium swingsii]|jgi:ATP synthase protein I|uniref:Putative F0F1-ATPase subunit Ca2+/Mg2+ transporter n=1 Tax=Flavobacterium swingsii TaxID=498292 RepID=A0A1I0XBC6_9FLAO|nr:AtpZ/AtpI family protein [Flavobacterium swingsii]SFA97588.1 Putative F0F1-ATPase subunit Ca2+/Mg2+ transporter [Flavobacterium swingsii]
MEKNNQEKKNYNKWLALINIPIQMGIIIFVFYKLGFWLDENYANKKVFYYKVFTLVGVFLALYNVYRQVNEIGKNS